MRQLEHVHDGDVLRHHDLCFVRLWISSTAGSASTSTKWTKLKPAGALGGRAGYAWASDSDTGKAILFGGLDANGPLGDTWAYDFAANSWTELKPPGTPPSARSAAAMVYDSSIHKLILYGGADANGPSNEIWAYDPAANKWTNLNPAGTIPEARSGASLVLDPSTGKLIMYGGIGADGQLNDTWAYDPAANTWTDLKPSGTAPDPRANQVMAWDSATGKAILFGGFTSTDTNDTWAHDAAANSWTKLHPAGSLPSVRDSACMAFDPFTGKFILFGGFAGTSYVNDTWAYDPSNGWTELESSAAIPARDGATLVYDAASHNLFLFGGYDGGNYLNDTWVYSP